MNRPSVPRVILLAEYIYQAMLLVYPPDFRRAYGAEMVQVFRTSCRQTLRGSGVSGVAVLWLRTLIDLGMTASRERTVALDWRKSILRSGMAIIALIAACLARYLHGAMDADQMALFIILGGSFLWGAVWPARGWWRPLFIGFGVAALILVGYGLNLSALPGRDFDTPSAATSLPLLMAGYAGALASWLVSRRRRFDAALSS